MCSGISIHTTAAAFGISAVFSSSIIAFNIVKFVGAAYLLYLAYKTLKERSIFKLSLVDDRPLAELFKRGFIMNVFNPKVALFFLAFLPQFVTPKTSYIPLQMLLLGVVFMLQAVIIFCIIGYFSGSIGSYLQAKPSVAKYFDFLTAGTFVALGIRIAISER